MKILQTVILVSLISLPVSSVYAATQGTLAQGGTGTNSTGTFDFTINRLDGVKITNMDDIVINTTGTATGAQTGTDSVCYYASTTDYSVDINSTNNFSLSSGVANMNFRVTWTDTTGGNTQVFNNNADSALVATSQNTTEEECAGGVNADIQVDVTAAQFNNKPVGVYTDTVSVVIALQ